MFREQYKAAFSKVCGDRTKIDKIFDIAEKNTQNPKVKVYPFRYAGTLAAAIAIIIAVAVYPNFSDFLKTEEVEYEPLGVVNYGTEKTWDNTAITSGEAKETTDDIVVKSSEKNEKIAQSKAVKKNNEESVTQSVNASADMTQNYPMLANAPMLSPEAEDGNYAAEATIEEDAYTLRASGGGGSAADIVLIEEASTELGEDKTVTTSIYSSNAEIESVLDESGTDMAEYRIVIVSEDDVNKIAYAEKNETFYKFEAVGLTDEEFEQFINEKL